MPSVFKLVSCKPGASRELDLRPPSRNRPNLRIRFDTEIRYILVGSDSVGFYRTYAESGARAHLAKNISNFDATIY